MEKGIRNANAVTRKLGQSSTRTTNDRLKTIKEERRKREEIMERQKVKAMATKWRRARGGICLSNKKEDESNTGDDTNPD